MAPERSVSPAARRRRGENRENQYIFELGVRGRKTGVMLPDTGIRDENGLEPMDDLFSPDKPDSVKTSRSTNDLRGHATEDGTISSEEDMDIENTVPDPTEVLNQRRQDARLNLPLPRSKSPLKTHLLSPARRHPSLGVSSPARGESSDNETGAVRRRLDFSTEETSAAQSKAANGTSKKRGRPALGKLTNGTRLTPGRRSPSPVNRSEDEPGQEEEEVTLENDDDSVQFVQDDEDEDAIVEDVGEDAEPEDEEMEQVAEPESEPEPEPELPVKAAEKNKGKAVKEPEAPAAKRRGRKPKNHEPVVEPVEEPVAEPVDEPADEPVEDDLKNTRPAKKARHSVEGTKSKGRTRRLSKSAAAKPEQKPKVKHRQKMAAKLEVDSPQVQRGPPIPRTKGLFITRRETQLAGDGFQRTRSGRNSIKPLAYWRNERVEYDEDETAPDGRANILLPSIKEVVRVEEVEQKVSRSRGSKPNGRSKKRPREVEEEEDEAEEWEAEPGRIEAEVRNWDPEDQVGDNVEEALQEIALSSAAIRTRDIPSASFKFAKTLTLPFFGSGMVDLAPGTIKKPKNSRKMQMVFFVFYGRVQVEVNGTKFRIGKGGQWQVPRGNFYSIVNDYDKPARIFFAQGCEYMTPDDDDAVDEGKATSRSG